MTPPVGWPKLETRVRAKVKGQFQIAKGLIPLNAMLVASPPKLVRDAIEAHRAKLNRDPAGYILGRTRKNGPSRAVELTLRVADVAARYLGLHKSFGNDAGPATIAQTTSTTMGLALLANGILAKAGHEVLISVHDFFSWRQSWQLRCDRTGLAYRECRLYDDPASCTADEIVERVSAAIRTNTRVVALTWVHSNTGVKLPIGRIGAAIREANEHRAPGDRILFCVDGVHGFGVENVRFEDLCCDFLATGCHKWLFGPRGTGIVCGTPDAWAQVSPTIPTFLPGFGPGLDNTPGGVASYEHTWAVAEAFAFHRRLGKRDVEWYTHGLNTQLKEGLLDLQGVRVATPMSPTMSAGIVCCTLDGHTPADVQAALRRRGILASTTTADGRDYLRFSPSILNSTAIIRKVLRELRTLV